MLSFVNYKKGCTRLAAASDEVYQLLAQGRWFSASTPASSTTKTGRHDIAEILLKVALKHQKSNQLIAHYTNIPCDCWRRQYNTSMQFKVPRENILVYIDQSHRIFAILYFDSKIINQS